jgi:lysozyme family protein
MAFTYTTINGQRVESSVARAFEALRAEFKRVWGLDLLVSSGTRTNAEQWALWNAYKNGTGNLAAYPGTSNHEEGGPRGPRALDVRDSGGDPGVTRNGTPRANWLRANAPRFGFDPAGYTFSQIEPWHIEYIGSLGGGATGTNPDGTLVVDGNWGAATTTKLQAVLGVSQDGALGPVTIKALQARLGVAQDGEIGPQTISALQARVGAAVDGQLGPETVKALQRHLNSGGTLQPHVDQNAPLVVDGQLGAATIRRLQESVGAAVDGEWGPDTTRKIQAAVGVPVDGQLGPVTVKGIQFNVGTAQDGDMGPATIRALQEFLNAKKTWTKVPAPDPVDPVPGGHTPNLITPTAADFPSWIRYEEEFDEQWLNWSGPSSWNGNMEAYYGKIYEPIEHHAHWWGEPRNAGTHDGNVDHLNGTDSKGTNYVTSPGRITLCMPLDQIALTTGQRNPFGWKSENDPIMTVDEGRELGYKTLGYLVYIVEKLNPHLKDEPIRLDKEFRATSCSNIQPGLVREYADKFANGLLDPATGEPPVVVEPEPDNHRKALEAIVAIAEDALEG